LSQAPSDAQVPPTEQFVPTASSGTVDDGTVSVIVVNWNGQRFLDRCLSALLAQTHRDFEIILVDNGSSDDSVPFVKERFPSVRLVESPVNVGFAAGNNLGLGVAKGTFIALLNNDAFPTPSWLESLLWAMQSDDAIGMCASTMVLASDPGRIDSAGIAVDVAGIAWDRLGGRPVTDTEDTVVEVFGPCAGAALYRRAMVEDIGFFDEDFFAYMGDVDLAWRAQWAGWRCVYVPEAVVHHVHSATGKEGSHFKNRLLGRNKVWLLCKDYPASLWRLLLVWAYDLMAVGYAIASGRGRGAVQGRIEALGKVRRMLAKRRRIVRRVSTRAMVAKLHPVEQPLAVRRRYAHLGTAENGADRSPSPINRGVREVEKQDG